VLAGVVEPARRLVHIGAQVGATIVWIASMALALRSQRHMGDAWRTGIEPGRPAALVTTGPFARVRNPAYTAMLGNSLALALLVPTILGLLAAGLCAAALQIQTRLVEEPHLASLHGAAFVAYARRTGRFLPHAPAKYSRD
jgi:protein-S-isoprenylcysteine O-methyltransferase Ste14